MVKLNNAWDIYYKLTEKENQSYDVYDIFYKISTAIYKYREKGNLTQKELAEKLGITQVMVSKLESGVYNYTVEQLCKIAKKLGFRFDVTFQEQSICEPVWNLNGNDEFSISDLLTRTKVA